MNRLSVIVMVLLALAGVTTRLMTGQGLVDVKAAERAIIKADEAFCQATIDRNLNRFLAVIAEDATFGQPGAQLHGRDAVAKGWAPYFQPGGPTLAWKPADADVLVGGDVGYTRGTWERHVKAVDGTPMTMRGDYLTVWHKQPDGSWKVVFDIGSSKAAGQ